MCCYGSRGGFGRILRWLIFLDGGKCKVLCCFACDSELDAELAFASLRAEASILSEPSSDDPLF